MLKGTVKLQKLLTRQLLTRQLLTRQLPTGHTRGVIIHRRVCLTEHLLSTVCIPFHLLGVPATELCGLESGCC